MGQKQSIKIILKQSIKQYKESILLQQTNQGKRPVLYLQFNQILPVPWKNQNSPLKSRSKEIQQFNQLNAQGLQQSDSVNYWPYTCVGLILGDYQQYTKKFDISGTGILINDNLVLTSAHCVYSRKLNQEYKTIKFIPGLDKNRHTGIYDVKRVYYPEQYLKKIKDYRKYNYAVLQLYEDLSNCYGYVGWRVQQPKNLNEIHLFSYIKEIRQFYFKLCDKKQSGKIVNINSSKIDLKYELPGNGFFLKYQNDNWYLIGIYNGSNQDSEIYFTNEIIKSVNQLSKLHELDLRQKIGGQAICYHLKSCKFQKIGKINLMSDNIGDLGCQHLKQVNLLYLISLNLTNNNITHSGCQYLIEANWPNLTNLDLNYNKIGAEGCIFLKHSNWPCLKGLSLYKNNIDHQGCKYLKDARWPHLNHLLLSNNQIGDQGCKHLKDSSWPQLANLNLKYNLIGPEGCRYLIQSNWPHLSNLYLYWRNFGSDGYKYLKDGNWPRLINSNFDYKDVLMIYEVILSQRWPLAFS